MTTILPPLAQQSASSMSPLDMGITAAAVLMLIYAARALFSKDGQAQMGCGFAFVAAVLWSFTLGRSIPDFSAADGMRLGLGAILLLPAFRAIFKHGQGDIVSGAIGLVIAFVVAGPVVQRYIDRGVLPFARSAAGQLEATDAEIERLEEIRAGLLGDLAARKSRITALGHSTKEAVQNDSEAMSLLKEYAGFRSRIDDLDARLEKLRDERTRLANAEAGTEDLTETELQRIRREVEEAASVPKEEVLEEFGLQRDLLELFEAEIKTP